MASLYILPLIFVILQLVSISHPCAADVAADEKLSFTIMNYLPKEDFVTMECDCVDVNSRVTVLSDSIRSCVNKWYTGETCPNGVEAKTFFCNFRYFARDRVAQTITPKYANFMTWAKGGPSQTFYQLTPTAIYGSTDYGSFGNTPVNKLITISAWFALYQDRPISVVIKDKSVGNGRSF